MKRTRKTQPNDIPKLLTIADLSVRWDMPRQSLHDKKGESNFPLPVQYVANNRTALFLESDIIEYEKENPYIKTRAQREARRNFIFKLYMDAKNVGSVMHTYIKPVLRKLEAFDKVTYDRLEEAIYLAIKEPLGAAAARIGAKAIVEAISIVSPV